MGLLSSKIQLCFLQRGNKSCKATERLRKKLQEQQSLLLLMSPSIPLRLHSKSSGKVSRSSRLARLLPSMCYYWLTLIHVYLSDLQLPHFL